MKRRAEEAVEQIDPAAALNMSTDVDCISKRNGDVGAVGVGIRAPMAGIATEATSPDTDLQLTMSCNSKLANAKSEEISKDTNGRP